MTVGQFPDILQLRQGIAQQITGALVKFSQAQAMGELNKAFGTLTHPLLLYLDNLWDSQTPEKLLPVSVNLPPGSAILMSSRQQMQAGAFKGFIYQEYVLQLLSHRGAACSTGCCTSMD